MHNNLSNKSNLHSKNVFIFVYSYRRLGLYFLYVYLIIAFLAKLSRSFNIIAPLTYWHSVLVFCLPPAHDTFFNSIIYDLLFKNESFVLHIFYPHKIQINPKD